MKAKLKITHRIELEVDGKPVEGVFEMKEGWEGMVKLECNGPHAIVIIDSPPRPANAYDNLPRILGGNKTNGEPITVEVEIVKASDSRLMVPAVNELIDARRGKG